MSVDSYNEGDIPVWAEWGWQLSEKAKEKFAENLRKSQAAQKKAAIVEGKFRSYDFTLAAIIQKILADSGWSQIILHLADLVERNVPSDLILAILSLTYPQAEEFVLKRLEDFWKRDLKPALTFDDEHESKIYDWINLVYSCSIADKESVLASLIDHDTWECHPSWYLLFYEILISYLDENKVKYDAKKQKDFSKWIFDMIVDKLQEDLY